MFDKIVTVTINPALDVTLWLDTLDFAEPNEASQEILYAGGKGVNISRVLASLGLRAKALGICGSDNGGRFLRLLEADGVKYDFAQTSGGVRENLTINLPDGRLLKINRRGSPATAEAMGQLRQKLEAELTGAGRLLLVFAGSLPPNVTPEEYKSFLLSFRRDNVSFALDTAFFKLEDLQEIRPFLVKPNLVEFQLMSGAELPTEAAILKQIRSMTAYVEHVLVSLGGKGLVYAGQEGICRLYAPPVAVRSTVGAGDTTLAAFLAALERGQRPSEAAVYAVAAGSASVMLEGTDVVSPAQVEALLPRVTAKKLS